MFLICGIILGAACYYDKQKRRIQYAPPRPTVVAETAALIPNNSAFQSPITSVQHQVHFAVIIWCKFIILSSLCLQDYYPESDSSVADDFAEPDPPYPLPNRALRQKASK